VVVGVAFGPGLSFFSAGGDLFFSGMVGDAKIQADTYFSLCLGTGL
jgi:hypothetical protein